MEEKGKEFITPIMPNDYEMAKHVFESDAYALRHNELPYLVFNRLMQFIIDRGKIDSEYTLEEVMDNSYSQPIYIEFSYRFVEELIETLKFLTPDVYADLYKAIKKRQEIEGDEG